MYNDKPCDTCAHYDPILKGNKSGGTKETKWAWCAKHSVYPFAEGPGQKFPEGVKRAADAATLAEPKIVQRGGVVTNCRTFTQRGAATLSKAALLAKLRDKRGALV